MNDMEEAVNDVEAMLTLLAVEPTLLPPAPAPADGDHIEHRRRDEIHTCLRCGKRAVCAFIAVSKRRPEAGPRWLDLCAACEHWLRTSMPAGWKP